MTLINGLVATIDINNNVIDEANLGETYLDVDPTFVLRLVDNTPVLTNNQIYGNTTFKTDRSTGTVTRSREVIDLGPQNFPLSPSQLRLGLIRNGISLNMITSLINSISDQKTKDEAMVWWEYTPTIHWDHSETQYLMSMLGIPINNLKTMWMIAKDYS